MKQSFADIYQDVVLIVSKMVFYEKGIIIVDQRMNTFVYSYSDIEFVNFYLENEIWMELKVKQ